MTVGLTGTEEFQKKLAASLSRHGIASVSLMEGICTPLETPIPWEKLARQWILFTSTKGVSLFFDRMQREAISPAALNDCRFAVIGAETCRALEAQGYRAAYCPERFHSQAFAEAIPKVVFPGESMWLFCAKKAGTRIQTAADECGITFHRVEIYDTVFRPLSAPKGVDYVAFGSAEGVQSLHRFGYSLGDAIPVCIGPNCAEACRQIYGVTPLTAPECTAESMAKLLQSL